MNRIKYHIGKRMMKVFNTFKIFVPLVFIISMIGINPSQLVQAEELTPTQMAIEEISDYAWVAYNDLVWLDGQPESNITKYTITPGENTGNLIDHGSGDTIPSTVEITTVGDPYIRYENELGSETAEGTDAYVTFHDIVDITGLISYWEDDWQVVLTFSNLDPNKTYTFATTANRDGMNVPPPLPAYPTRETLFTVFNHESAVNESTDGVVVISEDSVYFSTGYNTDLGYVARWANINPGLDGSFSIRVQNYNEYPQAYGPSVFMLAEEGEKNTYTLDVTTEGNGTVLLDPLGGTYFYYGTSVTLTPIFDTGHYFVGWSGQDAGDLIDNLDGTWDIVLNEDKMITANFAPGKLMDDTFIPILFGGQ